MYKRPQFKMILSFVETEIKFFCFDDLSCIVRRLGHASGEDVVFFGKHIFIRNEYRYTGLR